MGLELIKPVKSILEKVKEITNKEVEFIEKSDLKTYAATKLARKNMDAHLIYYKREHDELINHLIAHECGHILRMFGMPQEKRLIPMTDQEIMSNVLKEIETDITTMSKNIPFDSLSQIISLWVNGTVRQVTNLPPDIMIEKWLYDDYPDLRHHQLESIKKQHKEGLAGLSDNVRNLTPRKIYDASNIMNYVFFRLVGFYIKLNLITAYNQTLYVNRGKELANYTEKNYVNTYEGDITMINYWAKYLGLSDWFTWTNFENIPKNYLHTHQ